MLPAIASSSVYDSCFKDGSFEYLLCKLDLLFSGQAPLGSYLISNRAIILDLIVIVISHG